MYMDLIKRSRLRMHSHSECFSVNKCYYGLCSPFKWFLFHHRDSTSNCIEFALFEWIDVSVSVYLRVFTCGACLSEYVLAFTEIALFCISD